MQEFKNEIKQTAEQPICQISRQFIRTLTADRRININNGSSNLFFYTVLCSYATVGVSSKYIGDVNYIVYHGECISRIDEMAKWFRTATLWKVLSILDKLTRKRLISYTRLGSERQYIKFTIISWDKFNKEPKTDITFERDTGFFYMPLKKAAGIIKAGNFSAMDIIIDLWINAEYSGEKINYSKADIIVSITNGTSPLLVRYSKFARRWDLSQAAVEKVLRDLEQQNYLSLQAFQKDTET